MRELEKKAKEEAAEGGGSPHTAASPQSSLGHHNNSLNHSNSIHTPHTGENKYEVHSSCRINFGSGVSYKNVLHLQHETRFFVVVIIKGKKE